MKKNYKFFAFGLMAVAAVALSSCSNDEEYDVKGATTNLVFVNQSPTNTTTCTVKHIPNGMEIGSVQAEFPVQIQRPLNKAVKVTGQVDNSLIAAYNEANGTNCAEVPAGIIDGTLSVTIPAGEYVAEENITVSIDESNFAQLPEKEYLIPLRLSTSDADVSEMRGVGYIKINTSIVYTKEGGVAADMLEPVITSYTGWTYVSGSGNTAPNLANILRTSGTSTWNWSANGYCIIDMGKTVNVAGYGLKTQYSNYWPAYGQYQNYTCTDLGLELSSDGQEWQNCGTVYRGEYGQDTAGNQFYCLYLTIPARYLKIKIGFGSSKRVQAIEVFGK